MIAEVIRRFGLFVIFFATFEFLGFWLSPPDPRWASMINETRQMSLVFPHMSLFSIGALVSLLIGARLLSDGIAQRR